MSDCRIQIIKAHKKMLSHAAPSDGAPVLSLEVSDHTRNAILNALLNPPELTATSEFHLTVSDLSFERPTLYVNDTRSFYVDGTRLSFHAFDQSLDGKISFSCLGEQGSAVAFVREVDDTTAHFLEEVPPTFILTADLCWTDEETGIFVAKYHVLHVWLLENPANPTEAAKVARALGMASLDAQYAITDEHDLILNTGRLTSLEEMQDAYLGDGDDTPLESVYGFYPIGSHYNGAEVRKSFDDSAQIRSLFSASTDSDSETLNALVFELPGYNCGYVDELMAEADTIGLCQRFNATCETLIPIEKAKEYGDDLHDPKVMRKILREVKGYILDPFADMSFAGSHLVDSKIMAVFTHPEVANHRLTFLVNPISVAEYGSEGVAAIRKAFATVKGIPCYDAPVSTNYEPKPDDKTFLYGAGRFVDAVELGIPKKKPEAEKSEWDKKRDKVNKEDKARDGLETAIAALTSKSTSDAIEKVLEMVIDANPSPLDLEQVCSDIKKATGRTTSKIRTTLKVLKNARDKAATGKSKDPKGRIIFPYNGEFNFDELCDVGSKALKNVKHSSGAPTFSQMNGNPVRLTTLSDGKMAFVNLDNDALWSELNKLVTMVRRTENGDGARGKFDKDAAKHINEQSYDLLEDAPEIIYTPVYLRDGELMSEPGYNSKQNLLLVANDLIVPPISAEPTKEQAEAAANWIKTELLSDFPFCEFDDQGNKLVEPSMANAFAMIVTPFMRWMIEGLTPFFFVTKPQPGTGGTLLATLPMILFDGVDGEEGSLNYSENDDEMQKVIVAAIMAARKNMFFDNLEVLNSLTIIRAVTQRLIGGRVLGQSKMFLRKNLFNWTGTGNNTQICADMLRRIAWIRLNAQMSDLTTRRFKHKDLAKFVAENRGTAIHHILTMIRYWQVKGKPFKGKPLASFEDWSMKVGGVLQACGVNGFLESKAPVMFDRKAAENNEFLVEFAKKYGAENPHALKDIHNWAEDMDLGILEGKTDRKKKLGDRLDGLEGHTFKSDDKSYMFRVTPNKNNISEYKVVLAPEPPTSPEPPEEEGA
ncbi:MAG TPA: hypothetical protein VGH23_01595 [Rhizomicrobium sp.]|jgi:hypothetical protein